MNKIDKVFQTLKEKNQRALIGYVTGGDPSVNILPELIGAIERGGADIIEVGVPFSDPLADGPMIQKAAQRSLYNGFSLNAMFHKLKEIKETNRTPLVVLVYYNTIFSYGQELFIEKCIEANIQGLIIPDLPFEEQGEFSVKLSSTEIVLIQFATPVSGDRMSKVLKNAKGFIYCVTSLGVTGVRSDFETDIKEYIKEVRRYTNLPLCLGFGIGKPKIAKELATYADGVIVGSALVQQVERLGKDEISIKDIENFVTEFKEELK